ncbi:metal ABC transporter ATP-binding protein [Streptomyces sp. NY05-11A]|uniref:metal ABC transporter ATP-binding protein n=1 Tax=Streptomyces soliscabiei TaxID=588897 RepID=UPI0029A5AE36|nr:metal ABC transporter ATP-binding protein [Streptomyces sp. NY05-11A]MDX2679226.1 metal ABC transporter ATP-binding protein [Streptomyces sp. NY05-11A]
MRRTRSDDASVGLVRLSGVHARYDHRTVLRDVDLTVPHNAFIGVVGPSGSGKTTLLRLLLGMMQPTQGRVERVEGLSVGYVPQLETVDWNFPITVRECVMAARKQSRFLPRPTRAERTETDEVLERLSIRQFADRKIRELSGGQQQRMFLARALVQRPQLLLLDEPTSGLDVATRHEILHLLATLNSAGPAIVLTTHDLNGIANHLPHVVCLRERVVADGPPAKVITPDVLEQTFGARMEVLEHLGMLVVIDQTSPGLGPVRPSTPPKGAAR